ncbi:glycosyltransferase family 2 protein [Chryseobacterium sp. T1]
MSSLISIIVPCYNQSQYMDECLQSVLDQTYQNWECIIVNDGSPDNTEEVAKIWTEKDTRFKYLKKENGGLSSARNAGIEIAQGEWILPLDSDDKIGNRYLELAEKEIKLGYDFIYFSLQLFGAEEYIINVNKIIPERLLYVNPFYCSCIYPRAKWLSLGGYDESLKEGLEDWEFWINMFFNTDTKVKKVDYIGFFYRRKEVSMNTLMNNDSDKQYETKKYILKKHLEHYINNNSWIIKTSLEKERYYQDKKYYETLILKNWFGRIVFKILKLVNE